MKITILSVGSRGDFQPYIALGKALRKAGFQVRLPAPPVFRDLITGHDLDYVPVKSIDPQVAMRRLNLQETAQGGNQLAVLLTLFRKALPLLRTFLDETWQLSQGSDAILSNIVFFGPYDCADRLGIPFILAPLDPLYPTRSFASPAFRPPRFHLGICNLLTHHLFDQVLWQPFRGAVNQWRRALGLPPHSFWGPYLVMRQSHLLTLFGYSPSVIPAPPDWPPSHRVTGYWFLDEEEWQPPAILQQFLKAGPPPVYLGFGSMIDHHPERMTHLVIEALRMADQRGILSVGWSGLGEANLPTTILPVESVPHSWLFRQMAAVVHHGGAGTTAAGLRAGVPGIITPFMGDQAFWGHRVAALGVGPEPLSYHRLTAAGLAQRINQATSDQPMRDRAAMLGRRIRRENGTAQAVCAICDYLNA